MQIIKSLNTSWMNYVMFCAMGQIAVSELDTIDDYIHNVMPIPSEYQQGINEIHNEYTAIQYMKKHRLDAAKFNHAGILLWNMRNP